MGFDRFVVKAKIAIGKNGKIADTFASFTKPTSKKFLNVINKEIKS